MVNPKFIIGVIVFIFAFFCGVSMAQELVPTDEMALIIVVVHPEGKPNAVGETVTFKSQKTGKLYRVVTGADAQAKLLLPEGDIYEMSYKDFLTEKDYSMMEVPSEPGIATYEVEVIYQPAKVFKLENVYFDFGKASLRAESYPSLNELAEMLKLKPAMVIEISGHTDDVGDDASNLTLSQQRAESVRNYLIKKGIAANRIVAKGYGETMPVAVGTSDEARQKNRRTEVKIISQ
ncbi:MAG TPA: OmpA family protein [Bacteroidales bacterium]|nr:OmpA family protein [Bacteroidales bacterium]